MDLTALSPKQSNWTPAPRGRQATEKGPNPFLDKGWLKQSFDEGKAYSVTVPGEYQDRPATKNENNSRVPVLDTNGKPVMKKVLTGDAATVIKMLRDAANALNIGVTLDVKPAARKGHYVIDYLGQKRKVTKPRDKK